MTPVAVLLTTSLCLGPANPPADELPPGGYWRLGEKRAPEPKDGQENIVVGSILTSLGLLRAGSAAVQIYVASPQQCPRLADSGIDEDGCRSLRAFGWTGLAFGGLFLVTGVTLLGIGAAQRKEHEAWKRRYGISLAPALGRDRVGLRLRLRF